MKDYNQELEELRSKEKEIIEEAQKNGWILKNKKLYKEDKTYCLEIYFRFELDYESYGHFAFFKKTIPILDKEYEKAIKLINEKEELFDYIYKLCEKYPELKTFTKYEFDYNSEPMINTYEVDNHEEEVLEIFFQNQPGYNYIDGYINMYEIDNDKLKMQDNIDVNLNKYMRYN